jgi:F-type H+-transporting ATPase subunit a
MDQFKVSKIFDIDLFGIDFSLTNSSLAVILTLVLATILFYLASRKAEIKPSKIQVLGEGFFDFTQKLTHSNITDLRKASKFFPLIFSIFVFVLFANLFGMLPYSFTSTSQLAITFALASLVFFTTFSIGLAKHGLKFLAIFVPKGTPLWLAPVMFLIELFSYLVRPCTLSVRLAANMVAGHTVLKVIAGFVAGMTFFGFIPIAFLTVLTGFEIFVSCLQAYIFSLLTCIYINEAVHH